MSDEQVIPVKAEIAAGAHMSGEQYRADYEHAARDPDSYWAEQARRIP